MRSTKCIMLAIAAVLALGANAQELKKKVLGIEGFSYSSSFNETDVEYIRNQIINSIQKLGRVIVADRKSINALNSESEHRKQESAMDANTVGDMKTLNANSILTANLDQLVVTQEIYVDKENYKGSDGKYYERIKGKYPYMHAKIAYTIKITDCATGAVQAQENYSYSIGSYDTYYKKADYSTAEEVHKAAVSNCVSDDEFKKLILNTFRAEGKILQIEEGNEKKAKKVFVNMGSEDGLVKKQVLEVFKEIDIAGEISRKLVGEIEVEEVMGASRCLAKVKKGGDVILQVLNAGGNLPVRTREVKQRGFLGLGGIN